jgi:hypothetical protein
VFQSRNRNEPNVKTANVTELDKTGSQEHIIDDLEMTTFERTDSMHPSSKASTDGGAIEGHTIAVGAST